RGLAELGRIGRGRGRSGHRGEGGRMGVMSSYWLWIALLAAAPEATGQAPQATGGKVGEGAPTSALVWGRLAAPPVRKARGPVRRGVATNQGLPPGVVADDLRDACPGMAGRVRVRYGPAEVLAGARDTGWVDVNGETDFAHVFRLEGLLPGTRYHYASETAG